MKTDWIRLRLLAIAGGLSWLGSSLTTFTVVLRYKDEVGPSGVSAILLAMVVPTILAAPYGGLLADRLSTRVLVPSLLSVMGLSSVAIAFNPGFGWALVFLAITAACGTPVGAAFSAALPEYSAPEDLARVNSLMQIGASLGSMFGPGLAGVLIKSTHSYFWPFIIDGLSFWTLAVAILLLGINRKPHPHEAGEKSSMLAGVKVIATIPLVRALVIMFAGLIAAISVMNVGEVFLVMNVLGADEFIYGIVSATFAIGIVLGSTLISALKLPEKRHAPLIVMSLAAISAFTLIIAFAWHWVVVAVVWFFAGMANSVLNSYGSALVLNRTPEKVRGRVMASVQAIFSVANVASMTMGGALIGWFTVRPVLAGAGILSAVSLLLSAPAVLRSSREATSRSAEAELLGDEVAGVAD
ncbi:MAG: hypothetical protein RLZZ626_441 [Actinomycetota bacterium]